MPEQLENIPNIAPAAAVTALVSRVLAEADGAQSRTSLQAAREVYHNIAANIARVMQGQAASTRKLLAALASGGPPPPGGFPRNGRDPLAKALAPSIAAPIQRHSFPPPIFPPAILGLCH